MKRGALQSITAIKVKSRAKITNTKFHHTTALLTGIKKMCSLKKLVYLQNNVFADMDKAKAKAMESGQIIIDLSLGSTNLPAPEQVISSIQASLHDPTTHSYSLFQSTQNFRQTVANWYTKRYGVNVNPETEVISLIGCQEGTAYLPLAILNPGDFALLLDPGYPSHSGGVYLASGQIYTMPLLEKNHFLPIFEDIPQSILALARMIVLSYPHNPTGAVAPLSFFQEAVNFCRQHDLVLVHDFPYADIVFDEGTTVPSVLQADPNKEISIEFFSFSKSYNMSGFRIGYAIGNSQLIQGLQRVKSVINFNQYKGILKGATVALKNSEEILSNTVAVLKERRNALFKAFKNIGWELNLPVATMFAWIRLPNTYRKNSVHFCTKLLEETGVAVSPGIGFGNTGEGYIRLALAQDPETLEKAVKNISEFMKNV